MRNKIVLTLLFLAFGAFLLYFLPQTRPYLESLRRPQLIRLYFSNPPFRSLIHLIAGNRAQAFSTIWDTSEGILLSKKLFRPVDMDGHNRYGYLPNLKKLSFQTGTPDFQRKFEAPDSPRLRDILSKLHTEWITEASFDENGFRRTGRENLKNCERRVFFAGDSFTEGLWVNDRETFVSLYAHAEPETTCVINSGTNGYGALEESFTARQSFKKAPFQTLFLIHYPNDIAPDAFAVLTGEPRDLDAAWTKHLEILAGLAVFCRQNHIRMILVPVPPKEQFAMPETRKHYQEKLAAFSREHGIDFRDPFETLAAHTWEEIYLDWDPHFNPSGHRIFAAFLREKR